MGAALAAIGHAVVWLLAGRSTDTRNRAAEAAERGRLTGCALVVSVVPPSAAVESATSIVTSPGSRYSGDGLSASRIPRFLRVSHAVPVEKCPDDVPLCGHVSSLTAD